MKLKYYLRGIGIGVIVATLIMTISSVRHNNNLSEDVIIKEALKLGMVMPESTEEKDSLWGNKEDESGLSTEMDSQMESTENTQVIEDTQVIVDDTIGVITIVDEDAARHVSEKLLAAGIIEDAEDFRAYLSNSGYAYHIKSGTFEIPKGATYEEICSYIINK